MSRDWLLEGKRMAGSPNSGTTRRALLRGAAPAVLALVAPVAESLTLPAAANANPAPAPPKEPNLHIDPLTGALTVTQPTEAGAYPKEVREKIADFIFAEIAQAMGLPR